MPEHRDIRPEANHVPHAFEYADDAERAAATFSDANDIGKLAYQVDTGAYWRLDSILPTVWAPMMAGQIDANTLFAIESAAAAGEVLSKTLTVTVLVAGVPTAVKLAIVA